jgi:hypothetical protein
MGPNNDEKETYPMVDILNLALPYFGLIFIGFACGKAKGLPAGGPCRQLGNIGCRLSSQKTIDPSAVRIDVAHGAFSTALGHHRHPDGLAAAGAECVRDRTATRHVDRARIRRRADRNICVRHHAHQRDVVHPDRPAVVSVKPN